MSIRVLLVASIAAATVVTESEQSYAQDAQNKGSYTTELPPVEVTPTETGARSAARRPRTPAQTTTGARSTTVTRLRVYPTTPASTPSTALAVDKVPSSINFVNTPEIQRTNSLNVMDSLQQYVPGVNVSNVAGNEFQPNVDFRGYVASPVSGTPQGLAVYQNGVRINEAFGDTMNWDLIPTAAIQLGHRGHQQSGLRPQCARRRAEHPDEGRLQLSRCRDRRDGRLLWSLQTSLQWGKQINDWAIYGAFEAIHDDGYRLFSESNVLRFYGDIGHRIRWTAKFTSTWARRTTISAPPAPRRSNCCRRPGARTTRRRRQTPTRLAI